VLGGGQRGGGEMFKRVAAFAIGLCIATSASAQSVVEGPQWLERPDAVAFERFYPPVALHQGVVGRVVLECAVHLDTTAACTVNSEEPRGWGFADAALAMAQSFRISPARADGRPVVGGRMRVPLRFMMAGEAPIPDDADLELREFLAAAPRPDLPLWDEAPNAAAMAAAYPEAELGARLLGRAVLSCRVNRDRRLRCESVLEQPEGEGFAAAALDLSRQFRVSEFDPEFARRYGDEPFLLPLNFGGDPVQQPLSTYYIGSGPILLPPPPQWFADAIYPEAAREAGVGGRVVMLCTLREAPPPACVVEEENPVGHGFGAAVLEGMLIAPFDADVLGVLPGDQIKFPVSFRPSM